MAADAKPSPREMGTFRAIAGCHFSNGHDLGRLNILLCGMGIWQCAHTWNFSIEEASHDDTDVA